MVARSHPPEVQRYAVHVMKKWYSYLMSKRNILLADVLPITT